jgi:hypothetical protein
VTKRVRPQMWVYSFEESMYGCVESTRHVVGLFLMPVGLYDAAARINDVTSERERIVVI